MAVRAVDLAGELEAAEEGELLVGAAEGTAALGAAEDATLAQPDSAQHHGQEQTAGDQHEVNDGNREGDDGDGDEGAEDDRRPLQPVGRAELGDVRPSLAGRGAESLQFELNGSDDHSGSSGYLRR
jgi:hypothetical protein